MSRRSTGASPGALILDCEGLSAGASRDRRVMAWLELTREQDWRVVTCAPTLVEATDPRSSAPAMEWFISRINVIPVDAQMARNATTLLRRAGLHGHRHALDALLVSCALTMPEPRTILTSDPGDIERLAGGAAAVVPLRS